MEHSSPPDLSWESKLVEEEVAVRADGRGVMGQSVSAVCKRGLVSWRLPSDKPTELWRVSTLGPLQATGSCAFGARSKAP